MTAYVFPSKFQKKTEFQLDEHNRACASRIFSGPHSGKMFFDAGLAERDPRWIPLFKPLIADPTNEVQLVELELADIQPNQNEKP